MSFLENLVTGFAKGEIGKLATTVIEQQGGLAGLVGKFQSNGLGDIAQSWVSTGANKPVSTQQLQSVLGADSLSQLASKFGLSQGDLAKKLTQVLPALVDQLTPGGQLPKR